MGDEESVALFSHWGGMGFVAQAENYVNELRQHIANRPNPGVIQPLDRLEPETVMVDFIRHITKDMDRVKSSLYIVPDKSCGDNSDNGHHVIDLGSAL
jgi:hypothetical protein